MELEPPSEKDIETINDVAELEKMVSHINRKSSRETGSETINLKKHLQTQTEIRNRFRSRHIVEIFLIIDRKWTGN